MNLKLNKTTLQVFQKAPFALFSLSILLSKVLTSLMKERKINECLRA